MTTITREHLELAAKAAGYDIGWDKVGKPFLKRADGLAVFELWQPHIESLDTWRLAADCKMRIDFKLQRVVAYSEKDADWPVVRTFGDDGTRRTAAEAVTLAAAEIGRAME